jgi:hypothetical protein
MPRAIVEPDLPRVFNYAVLRPWHQVHDSIVYNEGLMIDRLGLAIINRRREGRAPRWWQLPRRLGRAAARQPLPPMPRW